MYMNHLIKEYVVGIDEVGRGPLAGPVMVAACLFANTDYQEISNFLEGITDSKKLSEKKRNQYYEHIESLIQKEKIHIGLGSSTAEIIDTKGIQYALRVALEEALAQLPVESENIYVYLDGGLHAPAVYAQETVIKGDEKIFAISIASVYAKVFRDRYMEEYGKKHPQYGFEKHKGYGTKLHKEAIQKYGVCDIHRTTWIKT